MIKVKTASGEIEGLKGDVYAFLGIPYAAAPTGERRFRTPMRPEPWDGVRSAKAFGLTVPQSSLPGPIGTLFAPLRAAGDDCLNLNVWTPALGGANLPVLVWIHGGGFQIGSGSEPYYDGSAFARDGIVLVSINYRLGAQGFLYLDGVEGGGNFGMLDQVFALEWIQENIGAFGGNPTNVTVAGESAGGLCVGTLLAMPAAGGLFRRAIAQSGASHNGVSTAIATAVTSCLAEELKIDPRNADALRAVDLARLLVAEATLAQRSGARQEPRLAELTSTALPNIVFQPVYGTTTLPLRPIDAVRRGSAGGVELLVGTTADEMTAMLRVSPDLFGLEPGVDVSLAVLDMMGRMIFGAAAAGAVATYRKNRPGASNLDLVGAIYTDWVFGVPAIRLAEAQSAYGTTRLYRLTWRGDGAEGRWGAGHGLDIPLVFDTCDTNVGQFLTGGTAPRELIDAMHRAWVAFATTGDPTHSGLPGWPIYDLCRRATMCFDTPCSVVDLSGSDERQLWDDVL